MNETPTEPTTTSGAEPSSTRPRQQRKQTIYRWLDVRAIPGSWLVRGHTRAERRRVAVAERKAAEVTTQHGKTMAVRRLALAVRTQRHGVPR